MSERTWFRRLGVPAVVVAVVIAASCSSPAPALPPFGILDVAVPIEHIGSPYAHQLSVVGATGPVTWTILDGSLGPGMSLTPTGLIWGTPSDTGAMARVQASDGTHTDTLMVLLMDGSAPRPIAADAALPDGARLNLIVNPTDCPSHRCSWWGFIQADSSTGALQETSLPIIGQHARPGLVSPQGLAALNVGTGVRVVDALTGELVQAIPTPNTWSSSFSGDGTRLLVTTESNATVYDTSTWSVVRSVSSNSGNWVWSPDSDEIAGLAFSSTSVNVFGVDDPSGGGDRVVSTGEPCYSLSDWSVTDRLALGCGSPLVTVSAVDGSAKRVVVTASSAVSWTSEPLAVFSPGGSHLAWSETEGPASRVVVAADQASAAVTVVADNPTNRALKVARWL